MNSLEIVNDIAKHLKDYLDDLKMTKEDFKLRKFSGVEHIFERLEEKISEVQTSMDNAQQIKQDLKIYNNVMKLIKDLFELVYINNEFDEYCEVEDYYIHEFGTNSRYFISESLFEILNNLNTISEKLEVKKNEKNKKSN